MATTTTSNTQTSATSIPQASQWEDAVRQQWLQALGYINPMLGQMGQYTDPNLYGQYTGIVGMQGANALGELQSQPQVNALLQQLQQAQQGGNQQAIQQLQTQLSQLPGGQNALLQQQLFSNAMATAQGQLPQLSPEAMQQIQQIGQSYETTGMNDVARARENAMQQWSQNTAQRGLRQSDTPSQAAWAPVEAELARQTGNIGAGRAALEAQTQLNFAQQMPQQASQLATYQQALSQSAQQNRYQLGQQSAQPYQNMFSSIGQGTSSYSPFTQQLGNLRTGSATQTQNTTSTQNQNLPWTQQLQGIGQGLSGLGQAMPYISQGISQLPNLYNSISGWFA